MAKAPATRKSGKRRRTSIRQGTPESLSSASQLIENVQKLIAENKSLLKANAVLVAKLTRISDMAASSATPKAEARKGRRPKAVAQPTTPPSVKAVRTRRKITDPATLERMRAQMAKARQVRAERLAAGAN